MYGGSRRGKWLCRGMYQWLNSNLQNKEVIHNEHHMLYIAGTNWSKLEDLRTNVLPQGADLHLGGDQLLAALPLGVGRRRAPLVSFSWLLLSSFCYYH